ncbi:MAG: thiamine pyrophosphate-binding protein [Oscillospiraceae bacterium]|nr:thiamine pyrophosphate-binding protein [Oscillospiraceae bacterium]
MKISGSKIVMECLLEQGVKTVFGFPGATVIDIYDELYRYRRRIEHVLMSHEQHAAHAADGYARTTGRTGVCIATSGPGATNLITGIAAAYMDSSPIVFITGNVKMSQIGRDSFQEVDIVSVSMPVTKNNYMVKNVEKLAGTIREAFALASGGRPGPVLVDITRDVLISKTDFFPPKGGALPEAYQARLLSGLYMEDINILSDMIKSSSRPLILAGGGVIRSNASKELALFAELINSPVALTMMGLGAIPLDNPLCTGMIGMHGTCASNTASEECDLLVAIGTRFSDRVTSDSEKFAAGARIVHIDIDRAEINKNIRTDHHITGDAKTVLSTILSKLSLQRADLGHDSWLKRIGSLKDAGISTGLPQVVDETGILDTSRTADALEILDTSRTADALGTEDSSGTVDASRTEDALMTVDASGIVDASVTVDASRTEDASMTVDASGIVDASVTVDASGIVDASVTVEDLAILEVSRTVDAPVTVDDSVTADASATEIAPETVDAASQITDPSCMVSAETMECSSRVEAVDGALSPKDVMTAIRELVNGNAIIVTDVGQHQLWTAQYYGFSKPNTFLTSGGYGAMGFGAGASVGACFGLRDMGEAFKRVILITGDGSFRMNSMELAAIEYYKLPVIIIVFNNHALGMVRQWQRLFYGRRYSATSLDRGPDFVKLAGAYSITGTRPGNMQEFKASLRKALATDKPTLIDLDIPNDILVAPMVSPGSRVTDFALE